jgi:2-succinyl-5-enolpyruvyl-6-hydroxy-3-cyclohexene-1-carboxylate synthase
MAGHREPTSGLRIPGTLGAAQFLLSSEAFLETHRPEVVVQFGAAPTSRAGLGLVGAASRLLIVDPDDLVADPHGRAEHRFAVHAGQLARGAVDRLPEPSRGAWLETWLEADELGRDAVDATIDASDEPYEGRIARDVAASLPEGSSLVVGSSMPVRDLMRTCFRARPGPRQPRASGIDGSVSTARRVGGWRPTTTLRRSHAAARRGSLI